MPPSEPRTYVLHLDVDSMFAQVHQRDDPSLVGVAVLVGGTGPRSVVAAASAEAKRLGVDSAMPMSWAVRRCRHGYVVVKPDFDRYREASEAVMAAIREHADDGVVEQTSIDEAYLAVTTDDPEAAGRRVADAALAASGLTCSVGVASTKLGAKLLSAWTKKAHGPGTVAFKDDPDLVAWMAALPARRLPGVGPVTQDALAAVGVATVDDLRRLDPGTLRRLVGDAHAGWLEAAAWNRDDRRVERPGRRKQVGHERTFDVDLATADDVRDAAEEAAATVAAELAGSGRFARTCTVKVRTASFRDLSRSATSDHATNDAAALVAVARDLADEAWAASGREPVRLVGFSASGLEDVSQGSLFDLA